MKESKKTAEDRLAGVNRKLRLSGCDSSGRLGLLRQKLAETEAERQRCEAKIARLPTQVTTAIAGSATAKPRDSRAAAAAAGERAAAASAAAADRQAAAAA